MSLEDGTLTEEQPLYYALERLEAVASTDDEDTFFVPVRFTILALGDMTVKIDTVSVHLLRTKDDLILVGTEMIPFEITPGADSCEGEARWSLCRIKAMVMDHVNAMMGKVAETKHKAKGWARGGCHGKFGSKGGPGGRHGRHGRGRFSPHHRHGHHGHHHWRAHRLGRVVHRMVRFFLIPALLGVIGGLMASAVGMIAGQVLVFLWQRFYRRSQRTQLRPSVVEVVVNADEKEQLLEDEDYIDDPPVYQDDIVGPIDDQEK
jgi:hypothetical protein